MAISDKTRHERHPTDPLPRNAQATGMVVRTLSGAPKQAIFPPTHLRSLRTVALPYITAPTRPDGEPV